MSQVPSSGSASFRDRVRRLPALAGPLPSFDPEDVPAGPVELVVGWFDEALAAGVPGPHAMTVSTADDRLAGREGTAWSRSRLWP